MTTTYLITGASRGLGLEFARQLLASSPNNVVIAAARNPSTATELQALVKANPGRIESVKLDVSDEQSVEAGVAEVAKSTLGKGGIDVLINNAGVLTAGWKSATQTFVSFVESATAHQLKYPRFSKPRSLADLQKDLQTNLFGVISITHALLPLLREGSQKKIWTVSSLCGSLGGSLSDGPAAAMYSVSKAAVNMYLVKLARELDEEKFTVIAFHPGYVTTDMNGGTSGPAEISREESVEKS
ncbi:hypothetical protein P7C70_g6318, partial [Phenoliferia sp. Uapishka_3]